MAPSTSYQSIISATDKPNYYGIRIYDILAAIDDKLTDYYLKNLDKCEKDPSFGDEVYDLFPFQKDISGTYRYHILPELNLNLIENTQVIGEYSRQHYINILTAEVMKLNEIGLAHKNNIIESI